MNKTVSLPRIRASSEMSKPFLTRQRKKSIDLKKIEVIKQESIINEEDRVRNNKNAQVLPLKRAKSQFIKNKKTEGENQQGNQKKYGLLQNGKLSKITQYSMVSKAMGSDRTKSSQVQRYDKQQSGHLKKQLNEITSSILILKKQIKAIQGATLQIRQKIKTVQENAPQPFTEIDKKIDEVRKKTENFKYDQEVLKNMKDRLKKINAVNEKRVLELREVLEKQERKIKILNQRSSIREESINKQKMVVKVVEEKQKTSSRLNQLAMKDYHKKLKQLTEKKQLAQKYANSKSINKAEYLQEVYKAEEGKLFQEFRANLFMHNVLEFRWNKYSQVYSEIEKAEKLMMMHTLAQTEEEFDPLKVYYGSFQNKKQLSQKIKDKEIRLAECMKRNKELQQLWKNVQFKQIDELQCIIDKKSMEIKSGKIQEKQVIQKQQRQLILEIRKQMEKQKQRATKTSRIKDWVLKLQRSLQITPLKHSKISQRLLQIIGWTKKQLKNKKSLNKTL